MPDVSPVSMDKLNELVEYAPMIDHTDYPFEKWQEYIRLMKEFKQIVPVRLFNRLLVLYETPGFSNRPEHWEEALRLSDQINLVYYNYSLIVKSPIGTIPFEQVLWIHEENKGLFITTPVKTWAITNLRVYVYNHETQELSAKGLLLSDTAIMNVNTLRQNRIGTFTTEAGKYGHAFSTQPNSQSHGDLVFSFQGKETFRLTGITDPENVQKLVENAKQQQHIELNR